MVHCSCATWNPVKGSQSKYRNVGFERLKKGGVGGWSHKNSLMPQRANTSKYFLVEFNSNKEAFLIPRHFTCRQFFESITKYQTEVNSSSLAFVISVTINIISSLSLTLSIPFSLWLTSYCYMCGTALCVYVRTYTFNKQFKFHVFAYSEQ